jgi:hypothetical protein
VHPSLAKIISEITQINPGMVSNQTYPCQP